MAKASQLGGTDANPGAALDAASYSFLLSWPRLPSSTFQPLNLTRVTIWGVARRSLLVATDAKAEMKP